MYLSCDVKFIVPQTSLSSQNIQEVLKTEKTFGNEFVLQAFERPPRLVYTVGEYLAARILVAFSTVAVFDIHTPQTTVNIHVLTRPVTVAEVLECCIQVLQVLGEYVCCQACTTFVSQVF